MKFKYEDLTLEMISNYEDSQEFICDGDTKTIILESRGE